MLSPHRSNSQTLPPMSESLSASDIATEETQWKTSTIQTSPHPVMLLIFPATMWKCGTETETKLHGISMGHLSQLLKEEFALAWHVPPERLIGPRTPTSWHATISHEARQRSPMVPRRSQRCGPGTVATPAPRRVPTCPSNLITVKSIRSLPNIFNTHQMTRPNQRSVNPMNP